MPCGQQDSTSLIARIALPPNNQNIKVKINTTSIFFLPFDDLFAEPD
jgi:hypothetical protein